MNKKLYNDILTLNLCYQIEDSKNWLDILCFELKFCKKQIYYLDKYKPFWFQKKRLKKYNEERKKLEDKINNYKKSIVYELNLIAKMNNN